MLEICADRQPMLRGRATVRTWRMTGREQPVALDGVPHFPEIIKQMPEFQLRRCVHGLFNDGSDYFNK
jgi:hypothetical protein